MSQDSHFDSQQIDGSLNFAGDIESISLSNHKESFVSVAVGTTTESKEKPQGENYRRPNERIILSISIRDLDYAVSFSRAEKLYRVQRLIKSYSETVFA